MYLLCSDTVEKKCTPLRPPGWGALSFATGREDPLFYNVCEASGLVTGKYNTRLDTSGYGLAPVTLAAMPWTTEYRAFASSLGMGLTGLPRTKAKCIAYVVENFTLKKIEKAVCEVLLVREWERKEVEKA